MAGGSATDQVYLHYQDGRVPGMECVHSSVGVADQACWVEDTVETVAETVAVVAVVVETVMWVWAVLG